MTRPRRSHLFMPGSNPRALEKARNLAADGLILDLEDSVAPEAKAAAREGIAAAIAAKGFGKREILIRTNGLDTPWWAMTSRWPPRPRLTASWFQKFQVSKISTRSAAASPSSAPHRP